MARALFYSPKGITHVFLLHINFLFRGSPAILLLFKIKCLRDIQPLEVIIRAISRLKTWKEFLTFSLFYFFIPFHCFFPLEFLLRRHVRRSSGNERREQQRLKQRWMKSVGQLDVFKKLTIEMNFNLTWIRSHFYVNLAGLKPTFYGLLFALVIASHKRPEPR